MALEPQLHANDRDRGDGDVFVENPTHSPRNAPFLYIPLVPDQEPQPDDRTTTGSFATRNPSGVTWVAPNEVHVLVRNAGRVASDVVWLDWQVRFCVDPTHARDEGFSIDHAGEARPDELQAVVQFTNISAGGEQVFTVQWPEPDGLAYQVQNTYFRARISGLWSRRKPAPEWDFAKDWAVTESCRP